MHGNLYVCEKKNLLKSKGAKAHLKCNSYNSLAYSSSACEKSKCGGANDRESGVLPISMNLMQVCRSISCIELVIRKTSNFARKIF